MENALRLEGKGGERGRAPRTYSDVWFRISKLKREKIMTLGFFTLSPSRRGMDVVVDKTATSGRFMQVHQQLLPIDQKPQHNRGLGTVLLL
jgi:hypothetical protein